MKRVWIGAAVGLAVVVGVMLNVQVVSAGSAIVITDDPVCALPGADENGNFTFGGLGVATTVLENNNKVMLKCKGEGIRNDSGHAQNFDGFPCGILTPDGQVVVTEDTHATVSASGVGTMTCTYKNKK